MVVTSEGWRVYVLLEMVYSLSVLDITEMGSVLVLLEVRPRRCCWCISLYYLSAPCTRSSDVYSLSVPNTVMMGALLLPVLLTTKMG